MSAERIPSYPHNKDTTQAMREAKLKQAKRVGQFLSSYENLALDDENKIGIENKYQDIYYLPMRSLRRIGKSLWEDLYYLGEGNKANRFFPQFAPPQAENTRKLSLNYLARLFKKGSKK